MERTHLNVIREIGASGLVEAVTIAGDRWVNWERPKDSTGTPTYMCINRGLVMKQAELSGIVAELFSDKTGYEIARAFGIEIKVERYSS